MRVLFLTNVSCPEGLYGPGATAELSDGQALALERVGAVTILREEIVEGIEPSSAESTASEEPSVPVVPELDQAPAGTESLVENVQISASDGAQAESHAG